MKTVLHTIQIVSSPDILGGKPRVEGRRIGVDQIAYHVIYQGWQLRELEEAYDLALAEIYAALSYYHGNREEIDNLISENIEDGEALPRIDQLAALLNAFLTTQQAAEQLGITERAIRKLIESGTLPAKKIGGNWFIHPDDLERDEVKNRKPGRPSNP